MLLEEECFWIISIISSSEGISPGNSHPNSTTSVAQSMLHVPELTYPRGCLCCSDSLPCQAELLREEEVYEVTAPPLHWCVSSNARGPSVPSASAPQEQGSAEVSKLSLCCSAALRQELSKTIFKKLTAFPGKYVVGGVRSHFCLTKLFLLRYLG